jgi:hypothetical protein
MDTYKCRLSLFFVGSKWRVDCDPAAGFPFWRKLSSNCIRRGLFEDAEEE